jgi:hypothetical protein
MNMRLEDLKKLIDFHADKIEILSSGELKQGDVLVVTFDDETTTDEDLEDMKNALTELVEEVDLQALMMPSNFNLRVIHLT